MRPLVHLKLTWLEEDTLEVRLNWEPLRVSDAGGFPGFLCLSGGAGYSIYRVQLGSFPPIHLQVMPLAKAATLHCA